MAIFRVTFCLISVFVITEAVYNITFPEKPFEITLPGGKQVLAMAISALQNQQFGIGTCTGECVVTDKEKISTSKCKTEYANQERKVINVELKEINITNKHSGNWTCTFHHNYTTDYIQKLTITVPVPETKTADVKPQSKDITWIYIASGVAVFVLLVIIGQTVCILYFKSKAKKAEMIKNLTPTKSGSEDTLADSRYIKHDRGSNDGVRESGIYEALDTIRERAPIPPPIETLPVSPLLSRSMSSQHLAVKPYPGHSRTNPRPEPKGPQNERKFNTIDAQMSLERIKNRPPLPLPTEEEIYEVVTPEASPMPPNKFLPKFGQSSPIPSHNLRVQNSPAMGRKQPIAPPGGLTPPGASRSPMMPPGHPLPGHMVRPPIGPGTCPVLNGKPVNAMAMGAMPVIPLPSMITTANLKPVKPIVKAPVGETQGMPPRNDFRMPPLDGPRVTPGANFRSPPVDEPRTTPEGPRMPGGFRMPQPDGPRVQPGGFRMPQADGPKMQPGGFRMPQADGPKIQPGGFRMPQADGPKMQPGGFRMPQADGPKIQPGGFRMPQTEGLRMTPAHSSSNIASKSGQGPPYKSKPPMPVPKYDEREPSGDPESYHGSSDEEFDCYDVLPEYRIYGNAPPKKFL